MTLYPNEYNADEERLCEGCLEPLADHKMRWCEDCQAVYDEGLKDGRQLPNPSDGVCTKHECPTCGTANAIDTYHPGIKIICNGCKEQFEPTMLNIIDPKTGKVI